MLSKFKMSLLVQQVQRQQLFRMLGLHVDTSRLVVGKPGQADPALQRFLSGVRPHVDNFVRRSPERLLAQFTFMGPFVTVHVQVFVQGCPHEEPLAADVALVLLVLGVRQLVTPQRSGKEEAFRTKVTLVLAVAVVDPKMSLKIVLFEERLPTYFALEVALLQVDTVDV